MKPVQSSSSAVLTEKVPVIVALSRSHPQNSAEPLPLTVWHSSLVLVVPHPLGREVGLVGEIVGGADLGAEVQRLALEVDRDLVGGHVALAVADVDGVGGGPDRGGRAGPACGVVEGVAGRPADRCTCRRRRMVMAFSWAGSPMSTQRLSPASTSSGPSTSCRRRRSRTRTPGKIAMLSSLQSVPGSTPGPGISSPQPSPSVSSMHAEGDSFSAAPGNAKPLPSSQSSALGTEPGKGSFMHMSGSPKVSPSASLQWMPPPMVAEPSVGSLVSSVVGSTVGLLVGSLVVVWASVSDSPAVPSFWALHAALSC
jgi:hypothetical protein